MIKHPVAGEVLLAALGGWRYLAAVSGGGGVFILGLLHGGDYAPMLLALALACGLCAQYYCWRVWMDCRLFRLLYSHPEQEEEFDAALGQFWGRGVKPRSDMAARWQGARRLFILAAAGVVGQWLFILIAILWPAVG
ncbi:hypothetical protein [Leminorella grimontii]|uniref:hypothetical protein n=1 Tax=Leminorella grimontii TaxID=82981 RepID=UPI002082A6D4|nr:hypothetical protein [Leminorella grimontii]GKX60567.1 hypothetical protein SOASR031_28820 [Leminorella grimontii]